MAQDIARRSNPELARHIGLNLIQNTGEQLVSLIEKGVKNLAITSHSFVTDCLENIFSQLI